MATGRNGTGTGRVRFVGKAEASRAFDRTARRLLGVSGATFRRRWAAGAYRGRECDPSVMHMALLLPLGR
jgi:hypothetical protein